MGSVERSKAPYRNVPAKMVPKKKGKVRGRAREGASIGTISLSRSNITCCHRGYATHMIYKHLTSILKHIYGIRLSTTTEANKTFGKMVDVIGAEEDIRYLKNVL